MIPASVWIEDRASFPTDELYYLGWTKRGRVMKPGSGISARRRSFPVSRVAIMKERIRLFAKDGTAA